MATRIRLLTLDAYNTLFKPKGSLSSQYAQEAVKYGVHVTKSAVSQNFGQAYKNQLERAPFYGLQLGMTTKQWWEELVYATFVGAGANKKDLDPVFDDLFHSLYTRFMTADGYTTFPDVRKTLIQLRQRGFQMGVISNSDERVLEVIKSLELNQYFDFVLPSCVAGYEKPEVQIFEKACEITGVRPEQVLHVGDDVEKDYYGARNAGMHATLLKRSRKSIYFHHRYASIKEKTN
ncbi:haloacid dehalogenase-like hydrolase domain-containing protein 3-like protein [Phascolomyces articulosus]|uniref:Haloacid dehalogenase-like hydrolase domain-containing protein 3-like protein n=1 Tax=Phascolomyces articulosus TaxID=60185 RepID=A0AAD5PBQ9_9FUNG|nr:haloacid dehalogenase-like hydrolase domain-containing protein 3-like protein [Phascolomyces articulosus]